MPFSLYCSFANLAGIPIKFCGTDGQPLPGAPTVPAVGPCAVLGSGGVFAETCAKNHASVAAVAVELRRPYIFNCHVRLAGWAIPVIRNGKPLAATIICGGVLLIEPDIALIRHVERVGSEHGVDPAELARSLDSVPVLSRDQLRAIADFLYQMTATFTDYVPVPGAPDAAAATPAPTAAPAPIVFPPTRRKETKKARLRRASALMRQSAEAEVVRLLRERRPDQALDTLRQLVAREGDSAGEAGAGRNLDAAETFTRLFRCLTEGARVPRSLYRKQSRLIEKVLSQKRPAAALDYFERACEDFVSIAEELTGEPRPRQIKTIQKFLERNLSKKLTLRAVGERFGVKERALNALIRKYCGMSFTDYVTSLRVSEARRMLQAGDLSVGEIARRTGFSDQSYFTKVLKSQVGSTPTEFRAKRKQLPKSRNKTKKDTPRP